MQADSKIISAQQLKAWRESVKREGGTLAVVTGSFDIFQPGNLSLLREVRRRATHVCVVVEPDPAGAKGAKREWAGNSLEARTECVSCLRDVTKVTNFPAQEAKDRLAQLRPYLLVDCLALQDDSVTGRVARDLADEVADVPSVCGCSSSEISEALRVGRTPVKVPPDACGPLPTRADLDSMLAAQGKGDKIVTVNGCFDILHLGHLRMLAHARRMGGKLVVLVNDDQSVRAYKGSSRPIFPLHFRLHALNALVSVDLAYPFSGDNPLDMLAVIRPKIHAKGGTFEEDRVKQERQLLESWGGRLDFCPMAQGYSTTIKVGQMKNS